jgi:hypothetical protein
MNLSTRGIWLALVVAMAAIVAAGTRGDPVKTRLSDEELAKLRKKFTANPFRPDLKKLAELEKDPDFVRLVEELRLRSPYVSIAGRLAFENGKSFKADKLPDAAGKDLEVDWRQQWDGRVEALQNLHSKEVANFVKRPGFGEERRPRPRATPRDDLSPRTPEVPIITLRPLGPDEVGPSVVLPAKAPATGVGAGGQALPALDQLANMHSFGRLDFVNPSGFGHIKEPRLTAGFEPHRFSRVPAVPFVAPPDKDRPMENWLVRKLELVSLLKHENPLVYESDEMPRMDKIEKAKTRALVDFETKGLASLRKGEDLVTDATTNTIRMLGSIRASKQCVNCHSCERGALLGAFSYQLQRDPPQVRK